MKILYFYQYFTTPKGSWGTRSYEFARRWVAAGDSVTIVTSMFDRSDLKPNGLISRFEVDGIDVHVINVPMSNRHGYIRRLISFFIYALLACWYALVHPADVVFCSSGPLSVGLPGLVARYLRGLPLVFEVRDLWPEGAIQLGIVRNKLLIQIARLFERCCYRAAFRVVALSEDMAAWIGQQYGVRHVDVVPNAADNELVTALRSGDGPAGWPRDRKLAVYAGTLGLIDDCGQILDMASLLQESGNDDIDILLIGDGKERDALLARARELKLRNTHFMGRVSKEEVMKWLMRADCALMSVKNVPFLNTASPNKLFDAFAAGAPMIQTTQGWIKRLLHAHDCGITVFPNDAPEFAQAVLSIMRDPARKRRLSQNSTRVAQEYFDRGLLARRVRGILMRSRGEQASTRVASQPANSEEIRKMRPRA